jgi:hypothetical protein
MQRMLSIFVVLLFLDAGWAAALRAQKTEAGLLAAWEQAQKSDASTAKFEKIRDRQYHFATRRFPFDGDLLVRNVVIEDYSSVNQNGIGMGTVEVELQGATDELYRTYARSYSQWNVLNTLYWDPQPQRWLTSDQYFQQVRARIPAQAFWPGLISFGWLALLIVIVGMLVLSLSRYNSKIKAINQRSERTMQISERNGQIAERNAQLAERNAQLYEQSMKLQEQNAKLFQDILEELKKISARS